MKQLQGWATWIVDKLKNLGALFDPEVLQWPGGTVIALVLIVSATVSLAFGLGRAARAEIA
jgi:hypothetical protein